MVAPPPALGMFARQNSLEQTHREIRNALRRYNAASIAEAGLRVLGHFAEMERVEELRAAPWLTLLLVKWAIQDRMVHISIGPDIPAEVFDRLRQRLWEAERPFETADGKPRNASAIMRALINPQVGFQREPSWGFARWPALLDRLDQGDPLRQQFRAAFGLEPSQFIDLATALIANVMANGRNVDPQWFRHLTPSYGPAVSAFTDAFVRDIASLRDELRRAPLRTRESEINEFPVLSRYPIFRRRDGSLIAWHRLVVARGLEEAVHIRLSEFGQDYSDPFSKVFEDYVLECFGESGLSFLNEEELRQRYGRKNKVVEAVHLGSDANVLVESKMSLFWDPILIDDNDEVAFSKFVRIREAVEQGWAVSNLLRTEPLAPGASAYEDFMLIVTSRQLNAGSGEHLARIFPAGTFAPPDASASKQLPLRNVFVLAIDEFESLCAYLREGKMELLPFLRRAASLNSDPGTSRMYFSDYLGDVGKFALRSGMMANARSAAEARITAALAVKT